MVRTHDKFKFSLRQITIKSVFCLLASRKNHQSRFIFGRSNKPEDTLHKRFSTLYRTMQIVNPTRSCVRILHWFFGRPASVPDGRDKSDFYPRAYRHSRECACFGHRIKVGIFSQCPKSGEQHKNLQLFFRFYLKILQTKNK